MFPIGPEFTVASPYPVAWIRYTPELAQRILDDCNYANRKFKHNKIRRMVRAMQQDVFLVTHQGIAFAEDGTLLDGQNRLSAIVESGRAQVILTVYNLPRRAQTEMDTGVSRKLWESMKFGFDRDVDVKVVALVNAIVGSGAQLDLIPDEMERYLNDYQGAINLSITLMGKSRWPAKVMAVVARASYTMRSDELREFCRIADGGGFNENQKAAAVLGRLRDMGGLKKDPFAIAQRSLLYFKYRKPIQQLKPLYGNFFPLPDEEADELPEDLKKMNRADSGPDLTATDLRGAGSASMAVQNAGGKSGPSSLPSVALREPEPVLEAVSA